MRDAWAALLRGDTAARDRYCELAKNLLHTQENLRDGKPPVDGERIVVEPIIALPDRSHETVN